VFIVAVTENFKGEIPTVARRGSNSRFVASKCGVERLGGIYGMKLCIFRFDRVARRLERLCERIVSCSIRSIRQTGRCRCRRFGAD
jgi:hypothetical protein